MCVCKHWESSIFSVAVFSVGHTFGAWNIVPLLPSHKTSFPSGRLRALSTAISHIVQGNMNGCTYGFYIKVHSSVHHAAFSLTSRDADTCGACSHCALWVSACGICLFGWLLSTVWLRCALHVCPVQSRGGVACVFVWCGGLWWMCAQPVPQPLWHFCPCAFEKVEHIIHRQGHMLSSRSPLLHPQNACCHAHSCQLVPVCLSVSITAGSSPSANTAVRFSVLDVDTCRDRPKKSVWLSSFSFRPARKSEVCVHWQQIQMHYALIFVSSAILFSTVISAAAQT